MRRLLALLALCASTCWGEGTDRIAFGAKLAKDDIAEGRLRIMTHGLQPLPSRVIAILRNTYGVDARSSGCVVSEREVEVERGYNAVILPFLMQKFGVDVLQAARSQMLRELFKEAEQRHP